MLYKLVTIFRHFSMSLRLMLHSQNVTMQNLEVYPIFHPKRFHLSVANSFVMTNPSENAICRTKTFSPFVTNMIKINL